jgi:hypothetical protein
LTSFSTMYYRPIRLFSPIFLAQGPCSAQKSAEPCSNVIGGM